MPRRVALGQRAAGAARAFDAALAALSVCADVAELAGCRSAAAYVAGAAGNLRYAAEHLRASGRWVEVDPEGFDVRRVGDCEIVGRAACPISCAAADCPTGRVRM